MIVKSNTIVAQNRWTNDARAHSRSVFMASARSRLMFKLLLVGAVCCAGAPVVAAGGQKPADWQSATKVEARADSNSPICQQISSNISKRVASIKSLQNQVATLAAAPPTTVKSALEDLFGTRQPNAKTIELERKIKVERKAADELNLMMRSSQCATVDIDAAVANQTLQQRAAPEAPKAMPDDLVPTPHRY